jgi:hypothetical protein
VITDAFERDGQAVLRLRTGANSREHELIVDNVIAGTGYDLSVDRLEFLDQGLRSGIARLERAPRLNDAFETSVRGLHFIGPASAMSFGPLFRFVVGAEYTAQRVCARLASKTRV